MRGRHLCILPPLLNELQHATAHVCMFVSNALKSQGLSCDVSMTLSFALMLSGLVFT